MAPRKSKAKKSTETMRQRQQRLLREQRAAKARQNQKALPPGKKGGELAKAGESKPENPRRTRAYAKQAEAAKGTRGGTRVGQPPGSANRMYGANVVGKAVGRAQRAAAVSKAGKIAGRAAVPLGMAAEVKEMSDRAKRDAERNKKLGRRPFEELRADSRTRSSGTSTRKGQGSRKVKPAAKPKATDKETASLTKPGGLFYRGDGKPKAEKPKPARQNSSGSRPSSGGSRPASKPAAKPKGQSKDMGENYRRWAAANPELAKKVKKGQAGYKELNPSKPAAASKPKPKPKQDTAASRVSETRKATPSKSKAKPQQFESLSEKRKRKYGR
jgi:hypothetical protein